MTARALHTFSAIDAFVGTISPAQVPARAFMSGNRPTGVRHGADVDANANALATRCALQ